MFARQRPCCSRSLLRGRWILALLWAVLAAVIGPGAAHAQSGGQSGAQTTGGLTDLLDRTTVLVVGFGREVLNTHVGSGVFVSPELVLTNRHVVAAMDEATIQVSSRAIGRLVPATIVALSTERDPAGADFALLRLSAPVASAVAIQITEQVDRLTPVIAAGYPGIVTTLGFNPHVLMLGNLSQIPELVVSSGEVNAIQPLGAVRSIVHTAQVGRGNSGGPLVDRCGRLVGINTSVYTGQAQAAAVDRAQAALHAATVKAFLAQHGVRPRLAQGACQGSVERLAPVARVAVVGWPQPQPLARPAADIAGLTARQRTELTQMAQAVGRTIGAWAVAIPPLGRGDGMTGIGNAASAADAERMALERCEFWISFPCIVAVRDGAVVPPSPPRTTPAMAPTTGEFDPLQVPFLNAEERRQWAASYQRLTQPKALVLHPSGLATRAVGTTPAEASTRALGLCRNIRAQTDPAMCFVYALGNRTVVGPIHRTALLGGSLVVPTAAAPPRPQPAATPAQQPARPAVPAAAPAPAQAPVRAPAQTRPEPAPFIPPSGGGER